MENMEKELTVPKWVLIVRPKIPQMPQTISAQNVCPLSGCPQSVKDSMQRCWNRAGQAIPRVDLYKGQLISKCLFGVFNFFLKQTKASRL